MFISLCRVFLLVTCCFIRYQVSEQPRVSLKTSLRSVVSVRTTGFVATELLWFETKLLGPFPWPWTSYHCVLYTIPVFLNLSCDLQID